MASVREAIADRSFDARRERAKRAGIASYATPDRTKSSNLAETIRLPSCETTSLLTESKQNGDPQPTLIKSRPTSTIKDHRLHPADGEETTNKNVVRSPDHPRTTPEPRTPGEPTGRKKTKSSNPEVDPQTYVDPNHKKVLEWARKLDQLRRAQETTDRKTSSRRPGLPAAVARNEERLRRADDVDRQVAGEFPVGGNWSGTSGKTTVGEAEPVEGSRSRLPVTQSRMEGRQHIGSGDHLTTDLAEFFPETTIGPDDSEEPQPWFMQEIVRLLKTATRTPSKPPIVFEVSVKAAEENARLLERFGWDLSKLIEAHSGSTLGYGSEFRTVEELTPLLKRHPNFPELSNLITNGMSYVFGRDLDATTKREELQTLIDRGNHKSAKEESDKVNELLAKDVLHGFSIPLPVSSIPNIRGAAVQPLGIVKQWTVTHDGTRAEKFRLTQDLSFTSNKEGPSRSINDRVDMTAYAEMVYGWCLQRIFHFVVSMRTHHPTKSILISKYDYSDAYRRIAHSASAAVQTIAIVGWMAYLCLRLTFGGSPNPPAWCLFSEIVTDLANEIGDCRAWDPLKTFSPAQPTVPAPIRLPLTIPLATAKAMAVLAPYTEGERVDGFIDDLINVFLDTPSNLIRQTQSVPLAMQITSRPHSGNTEEPIPRRPILSQSKLEAEGSPAEVQIVLGWQIDTRRLLVSLPDDKFKAWSSDLHGISRGKHCSRKEVETLVGRPNHTAAVIPDARHFLSRIRAAMGPDDRQRRQRVKFGTEALADLRLWEKFLIVANQGVSLNLLVTRQPDRICWSDSCPYGIGGYTLSGRAWRIQIPRSSIIHGSKKVNNLLEFLGMVINIWLTCQEVGSEHSCILAIGDNTSAIGWLHSTSCLDPTWEAHGAHLMVARKVASILMHHKCCLASQHLKGELNLPGRQLAVLCGLGTRGEKPPTGV